MPSLRTGAKRSSRTSSPFVRTTNTTAAPADAVDKEKVQGPLDAWVEPPVRTPVPSFVDHGFERTAIFQQMEPLGTMPSAKLRQKARRAALKSEPAESLPASDAATGTPGDTPAAEERSSRHASTDGSWHEEQRPVGPVEERIKAEDEAAEGLRGANGRAVATPRAMSSEIANGAPTHPRSRQDSNANSTPISQQLPSEMSLNPADQNRAVRMEKVVKKAIDLAHSSGQDKLASHIARFYQETFSNPSLAILFDAVITKNETEEQKELFGTEMRRIRHLLKREARQAKERRRSGSIAQGLYSQQSQQHNGNSAYPPPRSTMSSPIIGSHTIGLHSGHNNQRLAFPSSPLQQISLPFGSQTTPHQPSQFSSAEHQFGSSSTRSSFAASQQTFPAAPPPYLAQQSIQTPQSQLSVPPRRQSHRRRSVPFTSPDQDQPALTSRMAVQTRRQARAASAAPPLAADPNAAAQGSTAPSAASASTKPPDPPDATEDPGAVQTDLTPAAANAVNGSNDSSGEAGLEITSKPGHKKASTAPKSAKVAGKAKADNMPVYSPDSEGYSPLSEVDERLLESGEAAIGLPRVHVERNIFKAEENLVRDGVVPRVSAPRVPKFLQKTFNIKKVAGSKRAAPEPNQLTDEEKAADAHESKLKAGLDGRVRERLVDEPGAELSDYREDSDYVEAREDQTRRSTRRKIVPDALKRKTTPGMSRSEHFSAPASGTPTADQSNATSAGRSTITAGPSKKAVEAVATTSTARPSHATTASSSTAKAAGSSATTITGPSSTAAAGPSITAPSGRRTRESTQNQRLSLGLTTNVPQLEVQPPSTPVEPPSDNESNGDPPPRPPKRAASEAESNGDPPPKRLKTARFKFSPVKLPNGHQPAALPCPSSPGGRAGKKPNRDVCYSCGCGGTLVCCDMCQNAFHAECWDPPCQSVHDEPFRGSEWLCGHCRIWDKSEENKERAKHGEPLMLDSDDEQSELDNDEVPGTPPDWTLIDPVPVQMPLFKELTKSFGSLLPKQFELDSVIRDSFEGYQNDVEKRYKPVTKAPVNVDVLRKETTTIFDQGKNLKDPKSLQHCYQCGLTAVSKKGEIIKCDTCQIFWHLDCLPYALTKPPHTWQTVEKRGNRRQTVFKKEYWECPRHVDQDIIMLTDPSYYAGNPLDRRGIRVRLPRAQAKPAGSSTINLPNKLSVPTGVHLTDADGRLEEIHIDDSWWDNFNAEINEMKETGGAVHPVHENQILADFGTKARQNRSADLIATAKNADEFIEAYVTNAPERSTLKRRFTELKRKEVADEVEVALTLAGMRAEAESIQTVTTDLWAPPTEETAVTRLAGLMSAEQIAQMRQLLDAVSKSKAATPKVAASQAAGPEDAAPHAESSQAAALQWEHSQSSPPQSDNAKAAIAQAAGSTEEDIPGELRKETDAIIADAAGNDDAEEPSRKRRRIATPKAAAAAAGDV